MNSLEIRKQFLKFFEKNGHTIVPSSSLIPAQDPTLLFANAGMNQFKDIFLGKEKRSYTRATSIQKCARATDLERVGITARHLTYFDMMGNFSFSDYFKKEAIQFAWEFITKEIGLPKEKLYVTVYTKDDEAYDIWNKIIGIEPQRIVRLGEKDNFWQMGDTGPCGPCSEIYFDLGPERGCGEAKCAPGCDCDRFIEFWNLVFMQYNRQPNGELVPLQATGVDTGLGLERLCLIMQNAPTVFDTDLFSEILKKAEALTGIAYKTANDQLKTAFRVLADHTRSVSLLISDGCSPSNEGRGYVLRKIIRRAALFAQKLSDDQNLIPLLTREFITKMESVYPELRSNEKLILSVIENEISRFQQNLITGQNILSAYMQELTAEGKKIVPGEQVFKLYDTYGFPPELTALIAQEKSFSIDEVGFENEMKKQQEQSGKKCKGESSATVIPANLSTKFVGYEKLETQAKVLFFQDTGNDTAVVVVDESPFYVESGGQISDGGQITINNITYPVIELTKTDKNENCAVAIKINLANTTQNTIKIGDKAHCAVDTAKRTNLANNHTGAHLLQGALIKILGSHIKQAGSVVNEDYLRLDFTHHQALTAEQIEQVENLINEKICEFIPTTTIETTLQKAKEAGALSFFGEKYNPEKVRLVSIPGASAELCGGTHVCNTGSLGVFKIISETALATGTRRIMATTGKYALKLFQNCYTTTKKIGEDFKVKTDECYEAVRKLQQNYQDALNKIKQIKKQYIKSQIPMWAKQISQNNNIPFLYLELDETTTDEMRLICQEIEKTQPGFYFLINHECSGCFNFLVYANKNCQAQINLVELSKQLKEKLNMRCGGNAQAIQGNTPQKPQNLKAFITDWIQSK